MDALAWCRERLLVPGQPLSASLLFAAPADRDRILALRALAAEMLDLLSGLRAAELLPARLRWWQDALSGAHAHPALLALDATGGIPPSAFRALLLAIAECQLQPRFERFEELWGQCRALGGEVARLETLLMNDPGEDFDAALELGAAGWLLRRIRDIRLEARQECWRLPLDLQAQFQVARQDVLEARGGPGWHGLVTTLVARAVSRGDAAASRLRHEHRHLRIHWAVEKRLAAMLVGRPEEILRRRLLPAHPGNVWVAWRTARRLSAAP